MTYPIAAAGNTSTQGSATTTHSILLPPNVASGDLLLGAIAVSGAGATFSWPAGWIELADTAVTAGNQDVGFSAAYRVADGSEGSTVAVTSSASMRSAHQTWRITGALSPPEIAVDAGGGNSGIASPPGLSPSWGAADTLWLAMLATSAPRSHSGYPANYTGGVNTETGTTAAHVALRTAQRALNTSSEDPGNFTFGTTATSWVIATVAIRPAVGGNTVVDGTGVAGDAGVGAVRARADAAVMLGGSSATVAVGTPNVERGALVAANGVPGSGATGTLSTALDGSVVPEGVASTAMAGNGAAHASASVAPSTAALIGNLGSVAAGILAAAGVTGQAATVVPGLSAVHISSAVSVAGLTASAALGGVGLPSGDTPEVLGIEAGGAVGSISVPISVAVVPAGVFGATYAGPVTTILAIEIGGNAAAGHVGPVGIAVHGQVLLRLTELRAVPGRVRVLRAGWSPAGAAAATWLPAAPPDETWVDVPDVDPAWVRAATAANDWLPQQAAGQEWGA